jgi:hypothetical protein
VVPGRGGAPPPVPPLTQYIGEQLLTPAGRSGRQSIAGVLSVQALRYGHHVPVVKGVVTASSLDRTDPEPNRRNVAAPVL